MPARDPYGLELSGLPPEMLPEYRALRNRERIAEEMLAAGSAPLGAARPAGRVVVAPSWTEGLAKLANAFVGSRGLAEAEQGYRGLGQRRAELEAQAIREYQQRKYGTPQAPLAPLTPNDDEGNAMPAAQMPNVGADPRGAVESAMLSRFPALQRLGALDLAQLNRTEDREDTQKWRAEQTKEAREARMQELQMRLADQRTTAQDRANLQRELAQMQIAAREDLARLAGSIRQDQRAPIAVVGPDGKPILVPASEAAGRRPYDKKAGAGLPPTALKLQQDEVEALGIASSINSDLGSIEQQIKDGKLNPSLLGNVISQGRNVLGLSNEESKNFASFKATLEKLRNDSLRLNKGVQTEGDALRAWNELIANITDKGVVQQRLAEIRKINERAVNLRKMNIDAIRGNYGLDPLDTSGFESVSPAVGSGATPAASPTANPNDPLGLRPKK